MLEFQQDTMRAEVPFDLCPDLLSHHDAQGVFLYASSCAAEIVGTSASALIHTSIFDLVCETDRGQFTAAWHHSHSTKSPRQIRFRANVNGKLTHLETTLRVVTQGEKIGSVVCITRNIDELIQAEAGRKHWEHLVAQMPGIVWHAPIHPDGTRGGAEFMSDYLERSTGYTAHEWLTTPNFWPSIIHPDDLQTTLDATARMIRDGTPAPPYRVRGKKGNIIYFQSYMRVARDHSGRPERLYGLTLDVTAFKETEAANVALLDEVHRLSAPAIPVRRDTLVVPLIGALDEPRAARLLQSLLENVSARGIKVAIVDLTGVPSLDEMGIAGMVKAARAARLLGARVVLTGLSAEAARLIVALGSSLSDLPTYPTLLRALEDVR